MLLVKSKELKNSNREHSPSPLLAGFSSLLKCFLAGFLATVSCISLSQEEASNFSASSSILSVFLSLLVVIAIIFALAYVMRRFNVAQAGNGQMKVVASMMAGNKEKIMVVEVGDEQYLLGITAHNISHLATLDEPLANRKGSSPQSKMDNQSQGKMNFQQKLVTAMAQTISPNKAIDSDASVVSKPSAKKGHNHDK